MAKEIQSMSSLADIVTASIRNTFLGIATSQINALEFEFKNRSEKIFEEMRKDALAQANKMALELFQKSGINGISVEFKI